VFLPPIDIARFSAYVMGCGECIKVDNILNILKIHTKIVNGQIFGEKSVIQADRKTP